MYPGRPASYVFLALAKSPFFATMATGQPVLDQIRNVEWVVEDIDGGGIIDASRVTLTFSDDGRLTGHASCNRYFANWTAENGRLSIGQAMSSKMACAEALMFQEHRFLSILPQIEHYTLTSQGALVLETKDGRSLKAFPSG
ncbi:META domain-containing protein [Nitratireductor sp. GISD-1A_MAKvit]|uniref:META domain-containing protein n=1 Tax=Nitratireductor sp. GISD-1A_MAKvit TaxID=3234198 RepID=UPI003465AC66